MRPGGGLRLAPPHAHAGGRHRHSRAYAAAHRVHRDAGRTSSAAARTLRTGDGRADRSARHRRSQIGGRKGPMKVPTRHPPSCPASLFWHCAVGAGPRPSRSTQAQQIALRNHPRIASAALTARGQRFASRRAARPTTRRSPGTSPAWARAWRGSFGRRRHHFQPLQPWRLRHRRQPAAHRLRAHRQPGGERQLRSASQDQNVTNTRAQVLVEVEQAYYQALASESC